MKISVALCTYNGGEYLQAQLDSISGQCRSPDELVVCDDASGDRTGEILRNYSDHVDFPVRIEVNSANLRSTKNFEKVIGLCDGDLIVLADQDDVWLPHKLRVIEERMESEPDTAFIFTDAEIVDEGLQPLGHRLWESVGFTAGQRKTIASGRAPAVLLRYNVVTGATMAFRSRFRDLVLPIPSNWVHDGWMALILSMVAPCAFIEEPLILYRQHGAQQLGGAKTSFVQKIEIAKSQGQTTFESMASDYASALDRISQFVDRVQDPSWLGELERKVEHFRAKAQMRAGVSRRLPLIVKELVALHYNRYSRGWKSLAQDLFL